MAINTERNTINVIRCLQVDEQRKYLGGDSEHSVLVKGLDFALLEQNKAKVTAVSNVEDDEALEQAFFGVDGGDSTDIVGMTPQPKKKSRQDLIRELKDERRQDKPTENKTPDAGIEAAKKAGKFKPIGFKPIGGDSEGKKRKKEREGGEKRKKKRKVEEVGDRPAKISSSTQPSAAAIPVALTEQMKKPTPEPEHEPLDPDFDIFAGVEEYAGEVEDDEDDDEHSAAEDTQEPLQEVNQPRQGWFDEQRSPTPPRNEPTPPPAKEQSGARDEEPQEEPVPMRLAPLASSASVKDILAIDDAAAKEEKRKARKEKKKKKAELSAEGKVNRDYQKCVLCFLLLCVWDIDLGFAG